MNETDELADALQERIERTARGVRLQLGTAVRAELLPELAELRRTVREVREYAETSDDTGPRTREEVLRRLDAGRQRCAEAARLCGATLSDAEYRATCALPASHYDPARGPSDPSDSNAPGGWHHARLTPDESVAWCDDARGATPAPRLRIPS